MCCPDDGMAMHNLRGTIIPRTILQMVSTFCMLMVYDTRNLGLQLERPSLTRGTCMGCAGLFVCKTWQTLEHAAEQPFGRNVALNGRDCKWRARDFPHAAVHIQTAFGCTSLESSVLASNWLTLCFLFKCNI